MHLFSALALLLAPLATASHAPQHVFSNPSDSQPSSTSGIPSLYESAVQARRILHLNSIGTLSSIFPHNAKDDDTTTITPLPTTFERRPADVAGMAIGLMEYYASCSPFNYDPILLAIGIATPFKNAAAGSNLTLSLRYQLPVDRPPTSDPYLYLPANLPRFSLIGYAERLSDEEVAAFNISGCFLEKHPEASLWTPGNDIHTSWWARLVVREVYFFGGFGDRARISWVPIEMWRGISEEEVEEYRLVGERKD